MLEPPKQESKATPDIQDSTLSVQSDSRVEEIAKGQA